jgi:carboxyl-terminal processing protease
MQQRSSALWRVHWVFAAVGAITLSAWVAHTQDRKPSDTDAQVAQMMVELLERGHITRHKLDDDMAARWFDAFLRELDPTKIYFLQGDIDEFTRQRTQIDDLLQKGDVAFAYRVFDRYQQRVHERLSLVEELLAEPHDFTLQETIATDWDSMQYAGSMEEMRERWRKKVKFDLLRERVGKTLTNPPRTARSSRTSSSSSGARNWRCT